MIVLVLRRSCESLFRIALAAAVTAVNSILESAETTSVNRDQYLMPVIRSDLACARAGRAASLCTKHSAADVCGIAQVFGRCCKNTLHRIKLIIDHFRSRVMGE